MTRAGSTRAQRRPSDARRRQPRGRAAAAARERTRRRRRGMLVVLALALVLGAMSVGPLQTLLAATSRVEVLTASRDRLRSEVDALEERRDELTNPQEIELLARSELGMVKPGEQAYVVVRPEDELGRVHPDTTEEPAGPSEPWYRRLARALGLVD